MALINSGRFDTAIFEAYNEQLVQLGDEGLKEMYLNFMLIYTGEAEDEVLDRCNIDEVTEAVLGFAEMATVKVTLPLTLAQPLPFL